MKNEKDAIQLQGKCYDAFAAHYREYSKSHGAYINAIDQLIISEIKTADSMLDFGAGDGVRGVVLKQALHANYLVQADVSEEMLKLCKSSGEADLVINLQKANWHEGLQKFDFICALWNVFGLIPDMEVRLHTLCILKSLLKNEGTLIFDVNNRHNQHYGRLTSLYRRFIDMVHFDYRRGDANFHWEIDGKAYPAYGHLFILKEVYELLDAAGISKTKWYTVNYSTGEISQEPDKGQLVFICQK